MLKLKSAFSLVSWYDGRLGYCAFKDDGYPPELSLAARGPLSQLAEGLLFLHGLESNPGSSLQTEEEAGLP